MSINEQETRGNFFGLVPLTSDTDLAKSRHRPLSLLQQLRLKSRTDRPPHWKWLILRRKSNLLENGLWMMQKSMTFPCGKFDKLCIAIISGLW